MTKSKTQLSGNFISYNNQGIWISGKAGVGKTDLCVELLQWGHQFIADDLFAVESIDNILQGQALKQPVQMSLRGLGIYETSKLLHHSQIASKATLNFHIHLISEGLSEKDYELRQSETLVLGHNIPCITINTLGRKSIAALVHTFLQSRLN